MKNPVITEKTIEKKLPKALKQPHSPLKKQHTTQHEEALNHQRLVQFENKLPYTIVEKVLCLVV